MRTVLALAALAAVAATTSVEAQTCTNASLAFITESTGPFVQQCAGVVTAPALLPFAGAVALTDLLNPAAVPTFLGSKPIADPVNFAFNELLKSLTGSNLSTIVSLSQGAFSTYPASSQNPYGYNFTRLTEVLATTYGQESAAGIVGALNGTMLGVSNYVLCPVLKNITQSLIGCVPSNCKDLALGLCQNPTAANAAQLMGVYADKSFTIGTLAILSNIGASCGGAAQFFASTDPRTAALRVGLQQAFGYSYTASSFDVSCSVLANPALAGTFQYATTKSPTTKSAGAVLGAGVLAAVAAVASVVAF